MARSDDLSKPRGTPGGPAYDPDQFGALAERLARFFGTPRYIIFQTVIVVIWIIINAAVVTLKFDPYPFILLNLAFSTQAAYAAPLILLAQNRQAARQRDRPAPDRSKGRQVRQHEQVGADGVAEAREHLPHRTGRGARRCNREHDCPGFQHRHGPMREVRR